MARRLCALCHRGVGGPVVCAACHDEALRKLGQELQRLHGRLLTEQSTNAILGLFKDACLRTGPGAS